MEPREDRHDFLAKTQTHRVFVLFAQCYINRTERRHIDKCLHVNSRVWGEASDVLWGVEYEVIWLFLTFGIF